MELYRRHSANCKASHPKLSAAAMNHFTACDCAVWIRDGRNRTSAETRDWKEAEAKLKAAATDAKDTIVHGPTVADCVTRFLDSNAHRIKKSTMNNYRLALGALKAYATEKNMMFMRELTVDMLEDLKVYGMGDMSDTTKTTWTKCIRRFLKVAYQRGWTLEALQIKMTSHESVHVAKQPYIEDGTRTEVSCILKTAEAMKGCSAYGSDGPRFRLLVELMLETGMRCGDAVRFMPSQVNKSVRMYKYTFTPQKNQKMKVQKNVTVYLSERLKLAIDACKWMSEERPFAFLAVDLDNEANDKTMEMARQVYERMQAIGKKCGILDCRPHRLRDTFAVRALLNGVLLEDVSKLLGHSSVTITEKYYAAWVPGRELLLETRLADSIGGC